MFNNHKLYKGYSKQNIHFDIIEINIRKYIIKYVIKIEQLLLWFP